MKSGDKVKERWQDHNVTATIIKVYRPDCFKNDFAEISFMRNSKEIITTLPVWRLKKI